MLAELLYVAFGGQIAGASPEVVNPLLVLTILGPLVQGPLAATVLVATGTASRRSTALPRWHAIVGFIAAPVLTWPSPRPAVGAHWQGRRFVDL